VAVRRVWRHYQGMARLPAPLQSKLEEAARGYFDAPGLRIDFSEPKGSPALFAPDSVAWRVMKNPVALTIGGIALPRRATES